MPLARAIPGDMMPNTLNRTQHYIHMPRWPEPFGLIVAEAALCGCHIIVNDRVGAVSWKLDLKNPQTYERSSESIGMNSKDGFALP